MRPGMSVRPFVKLSPSARIKGQMLLRAEVEREAARQIEAAAVSERSAAFEPVDWQSQHCDETEIYSAPADRAGQRHYVVTVPLDTYRGRGAITDLQHAAGTALYGDWARGVCGASERDPTVLVRRSPMAALPEYQLIALQSYHGACAAMPADCREVTVAVCCQGLSISSQGGRSGWRRQVLMDKLRRGLEAIEPYYMLRDS